MPEITNDELARMMQEQFEKLHEEVSGVKSDVSSLKSDVSSLKSDVSVLKFQMIETNKKIDDLRVEHGAKLDNLTDLVEGLAKKSSDHTDELAANQAAHDRYNKNFYEIKTQLGVSNVEVVKPLE